MRAASIPATNRKTDRRGCRCTASNQPTNQRPERGVVVVVMGPLVKEPFVMGPLVIGPYLDVPKDQTLVKYEKQKI
jgi:hypothetical protein